MAHGWHAYGERSSNKVWLTGRFEGVSTSPNKEIQRQGRSPIIQRIEVRPYEMVLVQSKKHTTEYIFKPLTEKEECMELHEPVVARPIEFGIQKIYRFDNGFGASVVKSQFSYGGDENMWELAVIYFNNDDSEEFELTYETPITNDVIGNLSDEEVEEKLSEIKALSWRHNDGHVRNTNSHSGNLGSNPESQVYKKSYTTDENN